MDIYANECINNCEDNTMDEITDIRQMSDAPILLFQLFLYTVLLISFALH